MNSVRPIRSIAARGSVGFEHSEGESALPPGIELPPFRPTPLLRGGSAQTIVAPFWPQMPDARPSSSHRIALSDGDRLVVMEYCPEGWRNGCRIALMVHGLNGCYRSRYMVRIGRELTRRGLLVVRVNMRGCGPGFGLARGLNHAGRSEDARAVLRWLAGRYPASPVTQIGFSLGGNATLKMAGEDGANPTGRLDTVVAVSPPVDLTASSGHLRRPGNRFYDRYFARESMRAALRLQRRFPDMPPVRFPRRMTLFAFDDRFTAPRSGFRNALDYYTRASAAPVIPRIAVPTLILCARDDPVVECETLQKLGGRPGLDIVLTRQGGHMAFIGADGRPFGFRWMDALVLAWMERIIRDGTS